MDSFRCLQKAQIGDGAGSRWGRTYGCPCCNDYGRNELKKVTRKLAKRRLRQLDRKMFKTEI